MIIFGKYIKEREGKILMIIAAVAKVLCKHGLWLVSRAN